MRPLHTASTSVEACRRRMPLVGVAICALAIPTLPAPAHAQLNGVPVWAPGIPNTASPNAVLLVFSTTSGEDFLGFGNRAEWGFTGAYRRVFDAGFTWFTATAGVGGTERDVALGQREWVGQGYISLGGRFKQFVGEDREGAISAMAGFGYSALPGSSDEQNLVLGVDGTLGLNPGGYILDIWLMPRWSWRWTSLGIANVTQNGFGFSAGLTGGFVWGMVLQLAVDKVWLGAAGPAPPALPATEPWSFSAGLGFNF